MSGGFVPGRKVLAELRAACAGMSPALARIGDYVLQRPDRILSQTVTELAEQAGASEASVIRFCRDQGFASFQGFKLALATELAAAPSPVGPAEDDIGAIVTQAVAALHDTRTLLDAAAVGVVADRLMTARRIHLFGVAASAVTIAYLRYKLTRLGLPATADDDPHMAALAAAGLDVRDVALAVSTSGSTIDVVRTADVARGAGAFLVGITSRARSPLARIADVVLRTAAAETPLTGGAFASKIGQLLVVDVLFERIAARDPKARDFIRSTAASVADRDY